jgi:hypothetical protein
MLTRPQKKLYNTSALCSANRPVIQDNTPTNAQTACSIARNVTRAITLLLAALAIGCANANFSAPRYATLVNIKTGERCQGGFSLATRQAWVVLPEGTRLEGRLFGTTNAQVASSFASGSSQTFGPGFTLNSSGFGSGTTVVRPTRGEGWALLQSADGKKLMQIHIISDGHVTSGFGEAVTNDGRKFSVMF